MRRWTTGRYAFPMSILSPRQDSSRVLWLLMLVAWLCLVLSPVLLPGHGLVCCLGSMPGSAMQMPMTAKLVAADGSAESAHAVASRAMHVDSFSADSGPYGNSPSHAGCLVCAGAGWMASADWVVPLAALSPDRRPADKAVAQAPEGNWRRRMRPPSLV